ncbi:MAG: hypothetical protein FWE54_03330 [Methanimicrococcus sp.]|nr:hypothetical protein [Methanimicrococcus sp.]
MSIESDSEFFEAIKAGGANHRKHYSLYSGTDAMDVFYGGQDAGRKDCHNGRHYGRDSSRDSGRVSGAEKAGGELGKEFGKEFGGELIDFIGDIDSDGSDFTFNLTGEPETEGESLLSYDYEMDIADAQNLDEQIKSYAANLWELVSIAGDRILFKRPKAAGF